jgi:hypothetical protein
MTFYYRPSVVDAFASVDISWQVLTLGG